MNRNTPARLTAFLLAASLLLLQLAPPSAYAQRRRRRAAPPTAPTRPPRTAAPQRSPDPAAPRAEAPPAQQRSGRETTAEALLSADAYGVFAEVRKVGRMAQDGELKMALAALRLTGEMPKEYNELVSFVMEHAEALGEARYVMTLMPARPGLPLSLSVLEFPTVESAAAFEPKYRAFVNAQFKQYTDAQDDAEAAASNARGRAGRRSSPPPQMPGAFQFKVTQRRVGNCIIVGTDPFTLKRLRGDGTNLLADNVRFQSMRGRFASEPLLLYVDTETVTRGWKTQMELAQKQAEEMQAAAQAAEDEATPDPDETASSTARDISVLAPVVTDTTGLVVSGAVVTDPSETPTPQEGAGTDESLLATLTPAEEGVVADEMPPPPPAPPPPSESEVASMQLSSLMRGIGGGIPRIPETFALAVALEGGTVSLRLAVANTPDGAVNIIPFLPNVFNGPAITSDGAALAPADADIFLSTSLEWTRILGGLVATADGTAARMQVVTGDDSGVVLGGSGEGIKAAEEAKPLMPEAIIESVEKLFGFKFKEDLLPSLGNEVAVSLPLSFFTSGGRPKRTGSSEEEEGDGEKGEKAENIEKEKDAEAGVVVIVSLNDPEKLRKILPRVAMAFGFASPSTPLSTEKREGFDIQKLGAFSYVIINNHLALSEDVKAVRHVVDAFARRQTLEATNGFRDATAWQSKQRIAQVFVSGGLMKYTQDETKKMASASSDPVVLALLTQLDMPPEAASYVATNEGDVLLHEARLPLGLIKTYAASIMIGVKEAPIRGNEGIAQYAVGAVISAQSRFKDEKQKQRYGTLEELIAAGLIEKWVLERQEYKLEVTVVGDKFEVTATPNDYGKTGRRSFFADETAVIRAADHKGKPATAQDPAIDY